MADLEVNISSINGMQKQFGEAIETLESSLEAMYAGVTELNKTWEGPNHTEFVENFQNRYESLCELNKELKSYKKAVKQAGNIYNQCEESVYQMVQGI